MILAQLFIPNIPINQQWKQDAITIAGGNGYGQQLNQFFHPYGGSVDYDQTIYVADTNQN